MKVRTGIDMISINRMDRLISESPGILGHVFKDAELTVNKRSIRQLAGNFAAKEAISKVLGTGFSNYVQPSDIVIHRGRHGKPVATLSGAAQKQAESQSLSEIDISITHTQGMAIAVAVCLED